MPQLLNVEVSIIYKIDYRGKSRVPTFSWNCLILLVGAGRFELPTPCAQVGLRLAPHSTCFQLLAFQVVGGCLWNPIEACGS
jgi:hypothetical protein